MSAGTPPTSPSISPDTISPAYLALQRELHRDPKYGIASVHFAPIVKKCLEMSGAKSISDYGAGKRRLWLALQELGVKNIEYHAYDPAFPEYGPPKPADLVCCIEVLEHIEPEFVENVLAELRSVTRALGFFTIATGPAIKKLADGRNAHLIQQPSSWWLPRLCKHFEIRQLTSNEIGFFVVVTPRG
jgi:hypothetical protein